MARKRMLNSEFVNSDAFLFLPLSTQALYFHLNLNADDDGFIGNPKMIARMIGASEADLQELIEKRFLLQFEGGEVVIKHWRIHNTLGKTRYKETTYLEDKALLSLKENNAYTLRKGEKIDDSKHVYEDKKPNGEQTENKRRTNGEQTENADKTRLDKTSIDKTRLDKTRQDEYRLGTPNYGDVEEYIKNHNMKTDATEFYTYYQSKGWTIDNEPVKNWRAVLKGWEKKLNNEPVKETDPKLEGLAEWWQDEL